MLCGLYDGVHGLCFCQSHQVGRGKYRHVSRRAGADPDAVVHEDLAIDQHAIHLRQRKRRHGAGSEASCAPNLVRAGDLRAPRARGSRDFARIRLPVARDEDDERPSVTVEDERLHDLLEFATNRASSVVRGRSACFELFDSSFDAALPQERGHPLYGIGPGGVRHRPQAIGATEPKAVPL
jgi:hypothetical protein